MRLVALVALAAIAACKVSSDTFVATDAGLEFTEVARFPVTPNDNIDVLFVLDNSPGGDILVATAAAGLAAFEGNLRSTKNELPNVHIGVVTTDLGLRGANDPSIAPPFGMGPGACGGVGNNGSLTIGQATTNSGSFLSDSRNIDGTRSTNYSGGLTSTLKNMFSVGGNGCDYVQPIEAARKALGPTVNAGFLRSNAALAVIFVTNVDDCSIKSSTFFTDPVLGDLTPFRCTRYGVTCDYRGSTIDEMNVSGDKASCHSNENGLLVPISDYERFFRTIKGDDSMVAVRAIAGPPSPLKVALGTEGSALLDQLCSPGVVPAVRLDQLEDSFGSRRTFDACTYSNDSYGDQLKSIALQLSGMTGRACLDRFVPDWADCIVAVNHNGIPPCGMQPCYLRTYDDPSCPFGSIHVDSAMPGNWVTMRCRM